MLFDPERAPIKEEEGNKPSNEPFDLRTNKSEAGEGENASKEAEDAAAAQALEELNTRKEAFLATGKTEEEFDAAEKEANDLIEANKNKTPEQIAAELAESEKQKTEAADKEAAIEAIRKEERAKFLKSFGAETEEELKEKLNPTKPKTAEQLAEEANIYNVNLAKYAIENKVFNNDEWLQVQNMRKATDTDLVYNNFAAEYKEANKDRKLEDKPFPVTDEEIKDRYNELYHVDSENAALKKEGEKNLALKAKAIRDPLETKLNDIKEIYDNEQAEIRTVPEFKKFFQSVLATAIPEKLEFGTGDDKVVFDLSKVIDKAAFETVLIKEIGNDEFTDFKKGKGTPEQRARIARKVNMELLYQFKDDIAKENFKAGISKGTKTAAVGSNTKFTEPGKNQQQQGQKVTVTAEDNAKVAKAFALSGH